MERLPRSCADVFINVWYARYTPVTATKSPEIPKMVATRFSEEIDMVQSKL